MRNAGKSFLVAAAALVFAACSPPNEQPSDLPPGEDPSPAAGEIESSEPTAGADNAEEACTAEDIDVSDGDGSGPQVTVPENCTTPTELLTTDIEEGSGTSAETDSVVELDYVLANWADGQIEENTFDEQATLTVSLDESPEFEGWQQALTGAQEGDRRVITVPAELGYDDDHPLGTDALVAVADVLRVTDT